MEMRVAVQMSRLAVQMRAFMRNVQKKIFNQYSIEDRCGKP